MIRKLLILAIVCCILLGTAMPVLASGSDSGSNSDSGSSSSDSGSSSGSGSSDSGSSSGSGSSDSGSSSGSTSDTSSSSGSSDQGRSGASTEAGASGTQAQDRSQTHEPTGVPTQDQSPDRSRLNDGQTSIPAKEQSQDQTHVTDQNTGQTQSQDQSRLNDQYLQDVRTREVQLSSDQQLARDQQRLDREVALYSVTTAEPVVGSNAAQFAQLADEIQQSYPALDQAQSRITSQNSIVRFFMGGDTASAQTILGMTTQNQDRIHQMEQDLQSCDCNQTIRDQLQQELNTLSRDQDRLQALANQTLQDRGLFGGLFR